MYTAGETVKWNSHLGNQFGPFFKKLNTYFPYDPAILLLGIYPREMKTYPHKDLYLDAHSNIIQNTESWKQLKCHSTDEVRNKMKINTMG